LLLAPKRSLAGKTKSTFSAELQAIEDEDLDVIGDFVDLPQATRLMIDCINSRGKGRLTGGRDWWMSTLANLFAT